MLRKISTILVVFLVIGCSDSVTILEENPIPTDLDEIFEVNLVGYTTNGNREYISDAVISINGEGITSDGTGLIHTEKQLIGKQGSVIKTTKDDYLPTFKRVFHHRNLETITANVQMILSPDPVMVPASGGQLLSDNDTRLVIENQDLIDGGDIIFYSSADEDIEFDNLITVDKIQYLDRAALFYVDFDGELTEENTLDIFVSQTEVGMFNDDALIFRYDEGSLSWIETEMKVGSVGSDFNFEIDQKGWWAIGNAVDAVYGSLEFEQLGNVKIGNSEILIRTTDNRMKEVLYTATNGSVTKYFPIETELKASIDNDQVTLSVDEEFTSKDQKITSSINQEVISGIDGEVYNCELSKQEGYISIKSESQHEIQKLTLGSFSGILLNDEGVVELSYYDEDFSLLNIKTVNADQVQNSNLGYVACNNQMVVQENSTVVEDFEICRVRVNPNESLVIGENDENEEDTFLISFQGDTIGMYEGLFFSFHNEYGSNVNSEVDVEILIYNTATNVIAGNVMAEYKDSGEQFIVSFIGEME